MEVRSSRHMRTLVTHLAQSRPVRQSDRMRADIHDGQELRSNQRSDTLMQDRSPPNRQSSLATHGRTIQWVMSVV